MPNRKSLSHIFGWLVTFYNNCYCCCCCCCAYFFSVSGCCFFRGIMNAAVWIEFDGKIFFERKNASDFSNHQLLNTCEHFLKFISNAIAIFPSFLSFSFFSSSFFIFFAYNKQVYYTHNNNNKKISLNTCSVLDTKNIYVWAWKLSHDVKRIHSNSCEMIFFFLLLHFFFLFSPAFLSASFSSYFPTCMCFGLIEVLFS